MHNLVVLQDGESFIKLDEKDSFPKVEKTLWCNGCSAWPLNIWSGFNQLSSLWISYWILLIRLELWEELEWIE